MWATKHDDNPNQYEIIHIKNMTLNEKPFDLEKIIQTYNLRR